MAAFQWTLKQSTA